MGKIKNQWDFKDVVKMLKDNGYSFKRNTQGSHKIYSNGVSDISIPFTNKNPMFVRRIIKEYNLVVRQ